MAATVHGTAVAVRGAGVLLLGPSGSGKSDLALRLIDRGAMLVADDRVQIEVAGGRLRMSAPAAIAGLAEVRGVGVLRFPVLAGVVAALAVDLEGAVERLPEETRMTVAGVSLPAIRLRAFEASAPLKVELALAQLAAGRGDE